jgi:P-type Cu2+ transporter
MRARPMTVTRAGRAHVAGGGMHASHLRRLFWQNLVLAVPVVACSPMFGHLIGYDVPAFGAYVAAVGGTVMYIFGGGTFLRGAVGEVRARRPGMMSLITLAITVALVSSWAATLGLLGADLEFWWELALLIVVMLLGHWLEMRAVDSAASALDDAAALLPSDAERVEPDGSTRRVELACLAVGDTVLVRPGGAIPADGTVRDGVADIDESLVTGESRPVARRAGDHVAAGAIAVDSSLRIEVTAVGEQTTLAGIRRLIARAQASKTRTQVLADRAAGLLFWFALGAAAVTALIWSALGDPVDAVMRTVSVLVIACPHALGLAIPLVVAISSERAARAGILVRDRADLERMRAVDSVVFDKTGTLTTGRLVLVDVLPSPGHEADEVLALAAAVEADSEHPAGAAIVAAATARRLPVPAASGVTTLPGVGVRGLLAGQQVRVGRAARVSATDDAGAHGAAAGALVVEVGGVVIGRIRLGDHVRPTSAAAVAALAQRGVEVTMITGDAEDAAEAVAERLGVDRVLAGVLPADKANAVGALRREGRVVAMVGDGVNDAPALAAADVGIAIGAGTDVAIDSAGVVLVNDDPRSVAALRDLSRATYRKMLQNLWWAAGYNIVAVPLAAGVLAPVGIVLPMTVGALLMSVSTIVVALNAQTLRRVDIGLGARHVSTGRGSDLTEASAASSYR